MKTARIRIGLIESRNVNSHVSGTPEAGSRDHVNLPQLHAIAPPLKYRLSRQPLSFLISFYGAMKRILGQQYVKMGNYLSFASELLGVGSRLDEPRVQNIGGSSQLDPQSRRRPM